MGSSCLCAIIVLDRKGNVEGQGRRGPYEGSIPSLPTEPVGSRNAETRNDPLLGRADDHAARW